MQLNNASTQTQISCCSVAPPIKHIPVLALFRNLFYEVHASLFFPTLTYIKTTVQWHAHDVRDKYVYLFMGGC